MADEPEAKTSQQVAKRDPITGQFLPGASGNPSGRPRTKPFTDALNRKLEREGTEGLDRMMNALWDQVQNGDKTAAALLKHLWDRREGPVPHELAGRVDVGQTIIEVHGDAKRPTFDPGDADPDDPLEAEDE